MGLKLLNAIFLLGLGGLIVADLWAANLSVASLIGMAGLAAGPATMILVLSRRLTTERIIAAAASMQWINGIAGGIAGVGALMSLVADQVSLGIAMAIGVGAFLMCGLSVANFRTLRNDHWLKASAPH